MCPMTNMLFFDNDNFVIFTLYRYTTLISDNINSLLDYFDMIDVLNKAFKNANKENDENDILTDEQINQLKVYRDCLINAFTDKITNILYHYALYTNFCRNNNEVITYFLSNDHFTFRSDNTYITTFIHFFDDSIKACVNYDTRETSHTNNEEDNNNIIRKLIEIYY
jgi:hypothetical protein